jgi:RNA polymerase primary sigma factor
LFYARGRAILRPVLTEDLAAYLRRVGSLPVLDSNAQEVLWLETERGGALAELARAELVRSHRRLAIGVAKKYNGRGLAMMELIHAANLGLNRAVEKYNRARNGPFSAYAVWWMRRAIVDALTELRGDD